jgi:hypothetical protein
VSTDEEEGDMGDEIGGCRKEGGSRHCLQSRPNRQGLIAMDAV